VSAAAGEGEKGSNGGSGLEISHLSVTFGATKALADVNLRVRAGTIHALLGSNGSGKSTLIKVLAGVNRAEAGGRISVAGADYSVDDLTPALALGLGLRFVHQDLGMFDDLSVAENFALYARYPKSSAGRIRWRALHERVAELLEQFEIDATPETKVSRLRPASRTMLAVARALQDDQARDRILILDEPTASLPADEASLLLASLRRRAAQGQTIVLVSHRLQEVLSLADEMTVLRDGKAVATLDVSSTSEKDVVNLIAGREVVATDRPPTLVVVDGAAAAVIDGLTVGPVRDVSLSIQPGEILGIAGRLGSGRTTLLRSLFGDLPVDAGTFRVGTHIGPFASPRHAMRAGVAYVPEDRGREAAFLDLSVRANISIVVLGNYFRRPWLQARAESRSSSQLLAEFLIKTASSEAPLDSLSGGNQQKVILARWLQRKPTLLLLDEPTQGVDVIAREEIYQLIRNASAGRAAVVIVSSDFDELVQVCDRVLVITHGQVVAETRRPDLSADTLYRLAHARVEEEAA
jgi:ribose transport system ATP-binding protein